MASEQVRVTTDEMKDGTTPAGNAEISSETTDAAVVEARPITAEAAVEEGAARQKLKPGWIALEEEELPQPTYWPVIMALGITLLVFGVVTTVIISIVGIFLFFISLIGWIGDVQNEQHGHHE